jgi:serine/threonine protein kinase
MAVTPHYMSPEQCRTEKCDERTDIYSLGATYHTFLTGNTPYSGATPLRIMFEHCSAPVPDPRSVAPDIPEACGEIVVRAMAKKRAERYDNAREMQNALRVVLLERPAA